jgi:hypothetical protein
MTGHHEMLALIMLDEPAAITGAAATNAASATPGMENENVKPAPLFTVGQMRVCRGHRYGTLVSVLVNPGPRPPPPVESGISSEV